jgi:hypothetical protein
VIEQEQPKSQPEVKKRLCLASRIIRSAWITLLSILLAVSLFLQVPWKVTTLVFIFLFAATVLPRVYRKWFWAAVGCAAAAVTIWVFLPEADEGWRPYTFDNESATLEAKYAIPNGENAAVIYNKLIDDYETDSFFTGLTMSEFAELPLLDPWSSEKNPGISTWLERYQTTISRLQSASQMARCRFSITSDFANLSGVVFRLQMMERWAYLLITAANNDMAEKRIKEGLDKYITALQIGRHQNQQLSQVEFMAGSGIERCSANQLKRFAGVGPVTEEQLGIIENTLAEIEHNWSDDWSKMLDYEKLMTKDFWREYYEVNPDGQVRFARGLAFIKTKQLPQDVSDGPLTTYWHKSLTKARSLSYWLYMPSTPKQAGEVIDKAYERCYAMAEPDFNWATNPREVSIDLIKFNYGYMVAMQLDMLEPIYYNIHNAYLRTIALERGARLIVALRRYKNKNGTWPANLDDVRPLAKEEIFIDPTNGSSFVYKLIDEGFILYSKGKNGRDDSGGYESDDWLLWPPIGLKYKVGKKKPDAE